MIIGIDPGKNGGIAARFKDGSTAVWRMPPTDGDIMAILMEIHSQSRSVAYIEEPPKYTGAKLPGSVVYVMAHNFGMIEGICMGLNIPVRRVAPFYWQKPLHLGRVKDCATKTEWKNKLKAEAQRRYPGLGVTLATADALLILEYGANEEAK